MKVVLAEKPSVARELASHLKANVRRDGYFEGNGYQVTWALGHLVCLKEPGDYDPALKKWSLDTLPFVPARFELKLRDEKRSAQQFRVVKRLFTTADQIICATDAGREGELIFRYILDLTGCHHKPAQRLWLSSLTPQAIGSAFRSLRPLSHYDKLYAAAKCRSEADWIVGLNATRNYTLRYGAGHLGAGILWSIGRVQTPVLAIIARRDDEIRTFKPQPFWELTTEYGETRFRYCGDRFDKQQDAEEVLHRVEGRPFSIVNVDRKPETSLPPQLYDLTELQRDMNRRFGMSADRTLQCAQALYERKLITYPRTDSRYLTTDIKSELPVILQQLKPIKPIEVSKLNLSSLPFSGRIINDKKVTDHHAIIPTGSTPHNLSGQDGQVYDAILVRFIAAFYPPCLKEVTKVEGVSNQVRFSAQGVRITSPGWTALYPRKSGDEEKNLLRDFTVGESGPHKPYVKQGETTPPKHFTENTLLGAMETAGRLVHEDQLRDALKEKGLGTPATRASIIETLLRRKYIVRDKKNLLATDLGRYLIALVRDDQLKSPELTGEWEAKLKRIESGECPHQEFMRQIASYTRQLVHSEELDAIDEERLGDCPRCGKPVIRGKRGFGCSAWREGCRFVLWPTFREVELEVRQVRELLQRGAISDPIELDGRPHLLSMALSGELVDIPVPKGDEQDRGSTGGATSKAKAGASRRRKSPENASLKKSAEMKELGPCPLCGASMIEQKKSFSCSQWQSGCAFAIWKSLSGKRISARTAKTLLHQGETSLLKGFKSKSGRPFAARLKIDDGKVRFEFDD